MEAADLYVGEVYTLENLPQLIKNSAETPFIEAFGSHSEDKVLSKILSTISAVDVKNVYLSILKSLI